MARIFTNRKSGFIQRGGVKRRETRWLDAVPGVATLAGPSASVIYHTLTAVEKALRPFTVIRTRGFWEIFSDQVVADEAYQAALGLAVVSDQAVGIGVTAVPTPYTDMESDLWFVYEQLYGNMRFGDATGTEDPAGVRAAFDSRAMRKVEDGQDVISVGEASSISSGLSMKVGFRMLVKLH